MHMSALILYVHCVRASIHMQIARHQSISIHMQMSTSIHVRIYPHADYPTAGCAVCRQRIHRAVRSSAVNHPINPMRVGGGRGEGVPGQGQVAAKQRAAGSSYSLARKRPGECAEPISFISACVLNCIIHTGLCTVVCCVAAAWAAAVFVSHSCLVLASARYPAAVYVYSIICCKCMYGIPHSTPHVHHGIPQRTT